MQRSRLSVVAASGLMAGLLLANPAAATDEETKPYVVMMTELPAIAYEGGTDGFRATAPAEGAEFQSEARHVERYVDHLDETQQQALDLAGVDAERLTDFQVAANGFSVLLTEEQAQQVALSKGVLTVQEDELQQPHTDTSPDWLGLTGPGEAWVSGLDGEGVTIGVIDSGIWPEHPSFADDGSYSPPDGLGDIPCEFGQTVLPDGSTAADYNPADVVFDCNNKLVGARDMAQTYNELIGYETYASTRDSDGHGTHTASTAGGNQDVPASVFDIDRGSVSGIAPRASIVAYRGLGDLGGFGSDLAAAIDQAVIDGVDVINYSIGSSTPALDGPDDIAFLFAADAGVHVATSAGNSGPAPSTLGSPSAAPWLTTVGASTHNRRYTNSIKLGDNPKFRGISITEGTGGMVPLVDAEDLGNELCDPDVAFTQDITDKAVLCLRGVFARVDKSRAVYEQGGAGMILYNPVPNQSLVTDSHWVPSSHVGPEMGAEVKAYIDDVTDEAMVRLSFGKTRWTQGSIMADFSSRGPIGSPGSPDIIKPDVTAPGVNILAGNTPTPTSGRPGELFQSISGTSMSSPHVAGLMALMDQAHPDWSPAAVRSAIMTSARRNVKKEDGATTADPFDFGAGHVRPNKVDTLGGMFNPSVVYEADIFDYAAFACGQDVIFTAATCDTVAGFGYDFDATALNLPSVGNSAVAGTATMQRTLTNVTDEDIRVWGRTRAPEGFEITLNPRIIDIPAGGSATFDIEVVATTASPGIWSHGWMTWSGGGYRHRSPVSLQAALLGAPTEVTAAAADGGTSFDVGFGYTGDYTAAAHGLAPDVQLTGDVVQDPDQAFDPTDGYSTQVDVDLTGAALWRLTMNQDDVVGPGADVVDLDIYVLDAAGNLVGSSGAGGTAEFIELLLPEDGTYSVYIHGWQTGDETVQFTAHTWTVPLATGGSLSIDSAPASATIGTSDTVVVSWSDVDGPSLGAVSHTGPEGLIGLTLVNVQD